MSVRRAQEEISSREFIEWLAFDSIDPGEPVRSDMNAAMISSIIAKMLNTLIRRLLELMDSEPSNNSQDQMLMVVLLN